MRRHVAIGVVALVIVASVTMLWFSSWHATRSRFVEMASTPAAASCWDAAARRAPWFPVWNRYQIGQSIRIRANRFLVVDCGRESFWTCDWTIRGNWSVQLPRGGFALHEDGSGRVTPLAGVTAPGLGFTSGWVITGSDDAITLVDCELGESFTVDRPSIVHPR